MIYGYNFKCLGYAGVYLFLLFLLQKYEKYDTFSDDNFHFFLQQEKYVYYMGMFS